MKNEIIQKLPHFSVNAIYIKKVEKKEVSFDQEYILIPNSPVQKVLQTHISKNPCKRS